ncbi:MAG: electron transfer flavoprotein subunit alpha/FixB family protein [Pseudomonadota bacterium]
MRAEGGERKAETGDVWVIVRHREGALQGETCGLIAEAGRLLSGRQRKGEIAAVALGSGLEKALETLGACGAHKVLCIDDACLRRYQGELFAGILCELAVDMKPSFILMVQSPETADLSARLAALMDTVSVTRAVDVKRDDKGKTRVIRPVANGYLFEALALDSQGPPIICFLPSALTSPDPGAPVEIEIRTFPMDDSWNHLKTKILEIMETSADDLSLEEADVIVSGGRGAGRESFGLIHELARAIVGSVGGTRPVIDRQILPFDRQIGQTGRTVTPRLLIACGISGANEFTAGMEKSQQVIAVNTDPGARIFRFADLGIVGDLQEILPILIKRLKEKDEPR